MSTKIDSVSRSRYARLPQPVPPKRRIEHPMTLPAWAKGTNRAAGLSKARE
jgi:hypothetical protein